MIIYFLQKEFSHMAGLALAICRFKNDVSKQPQKDRSDLVGLSLLQFLPALA